MRKTHLIGLFLWRGGILFAAAYAFYEGASLALRYVDLPDQIKVGLGFAISGAALVLLSLILERIQDAREEGDLHE